MIRTLSSEGNPQAELRKRIEQLSTVEIPRLEAEVEADWDVAAVGLEHARQEMHDAARLLATLDASPDTRDKSFVELNDYVTIRAHRSRKTETIVVHAEDLIIRAPGFISVRSPLGAAVLGRRVGESVEVRGPGKARRFVIENVRRP